ncbi:hypothetical protein C1H46_014351 [Malus baccata]|uniref:FAS1 domain-containing protein n=1 Tax=Malus baccata TaxID=106549 RepID=A0A540MP16_MALBA|nr:hypothetical protein C1H46_014351 [Malus baccata]
MHREYDKNDGSRQHRSKPTLFESQPGFKTFGIKEKVDEIKAREMQLCEDARIARKDGQLIDAEKMNCESSRVADIAVQVKQIVPENLRETTTHIPDRKEFHEVQKSHHPPPQLISSADNMKGILTAPAPSASDTNITALLEKAGAKKFASLIVSTGVIKTYQSAADKGLTIFAPNDEAFKAKGVPDLNKLTNAELVSILQYHTVAGYSSIGSLKTSKAPISTLATNGAGKYDLTVTTAGDQVTLHTRVGSSRVADTVPDSTPAAIFTVDNVLLPSELLSPSHLLPSASDRPEVPVQDAAAAAENWVSHFPWFQLKCSWIRLCSKAI